MFKEVKKCPQCNQVKKREEFYLSNIRKNGLTGYCRKCTSKKQKEYKEKRSEHYKMLQRRHYWKHRDKNKDKKNKWQREQYANNPIYKETCKRARKRRKKRYASDPIFRKKVQGYALKRASTTKGKLSGAMRCGMRRALKEGKKGLPWEFFIDYTIDELKSHIESKFIEGMTWENMGEWHIDHIIPISAFNINSSEDLDFKKCWALKNLQPLWQKDNLSKRNRLKKPFQPTLI